MKLSVHHDDHKKLDSNLFFFHRYAPECLTSLKFTTQGDVWSYGTTLWEIFTFGENPSTYLHKVVSTKGQEYNLVSFLIMCWCCSVGMCSIIHIFELIVKPPMKDTICKKKIFLSFLIPDRLYFQTSKKRAPLYR